MTDQNIIQNKFKINLYETIPSSLINIKVIMKDSEKWKFYRRDKYIKLLKFRSD